MLKVLYILEALRNKNIMSRTSTWIYAMLWIEMLNVLYILEALRHNNFMPGLLPG